MKDKKEKEKRVYIHLLIDVRFTEFLDFMKEKNGFVRSRAMELAILKKYKNEYNAFLEKRKKGADSL